MTKLVEVVTIICCSVCDKEVIAIPGDFEYLDAKGEIAAYCGEHAG